MATANTYDLVPYPGRSIAFSHPDRLATVARLLGLAPAPIDRCRVLELGCGEGMNLLPMAELLPQSQFVGIDYTARHIETARAAAAEMGLANVRFETRDIRDVGPEDGEFDYIICHGVYSWVPEDVRDALLRVCGAQLTPHGVAYVSFNTLPGWYFRKPIRDLMRFRTRKIDDPIEGVEAGYEFLKLAGRALPPTSSPFGFLLHEYAEAFEERGPIGSPFRTSYALHDELNEVNEPVYFADFAAHAGRHGLRYLADAEFQEGLPARFPSYVNAELDAISTSVEEMEQYRDFFLNRMFRRALLCRSDREPERGARMDLATLRSFYFRAEAMARAKSERARALEEGAAVKTEGTLEGEGPVTFQGPNDATITIAHPVSKAGLAYLGEEFPRAVAFDELARVAAARAGVAPDPASIGPLAADLMQAFTYSGRLVSLHVHDVPCRKAAGPRPRATLTSRYAAARGADLVTNVAHMQVELNPVSQYLLPFLDGTRTRDDLIRELQRLVDADELDPGCQEGEPVEDALRSQLEASLASWGERGLLLE